MLDTLINYLKQPSTYQGLTKVAAGLGFVTFPELFPLIITGLVLVDGLIDTFKDDDPDIMNTKRKQLAAKAEQLGMKVVPKG